MYAILGVIAFLVLKIILKIEKNIVTPACNEEKHLPSLIESVLVQSFLPAEWVIVDDGSIDNSSNVIQKQL